MELGQMRVEANISVSKDPTKFGTKVEVKNLNSFAAVEGAIDYEIARHMEVLENGGTIVQETRGWDENKNITVSQRKKESAHDYRYFPDPDLPVIVKNCPSGTVKETSFSAIISESPFLNIFEMLSALIMIS